MTPTPPNFDRRPTRYDPDHSIEMELPPMPELPPATTAPAQPTGILTPGQKSWLFALIGVIIGGLVNRYLPGTPVPPIPAEVLTQIAETHKAATIAHANVVSLHSQVDHLQRLVLTRTAAPVPVKVLDTGKE